MEIIRQLPIPGIPALIDIAFMSLIIYAGLIWFKRRQAAFVLTGVLIVSCFYLLSIQFNLYLTTAVLDKFFAVIFIALVVIFQEELRHFFEQVAVWSLNRRFTKKNVIQLTRKEVEILVRTLADLAREYVGALIVIKGKDAIVRHLEGGVDLNGELSEPLLKSLFDPNSIGHDGAVILDGNRVTQFSCHLPLSKNLKKLHAGGTRHAAALGLVELTDALCLVVSEERGVISLAVNAEIREITDLEKLTVLLERYYQDLNPRTGSSFGREFFRTNIREKLLAILISIVLWFLLVAGPRTAFKLFPEP